MQVFHFKIQRNLFQIGAFNENGNMRTFPKISVSMNEGKVIISVLDVKIRKIIESYENLFSTCLPASYIVVDSYFDETGNKFILRFVDSRNYKQATFENLPDYISHIRTLSPLEFELDGAHHISLNDYPHFAILGSTGSGKTFLAQLLMMQFISKGFYVSVLDVKQSYSAFSDLVDYETNPQKILQRLRDISEEMISRQAALSLILKDNPRALAVDYGYNPIVVFIEI